jgi:sulfatase maturation enzyme AslB (radical SAM superfamily)
MRRGRAVVRCDVVFCRTAAGTGADAPDGRAAARATAQLSFGNVRAPGPFLAAMTLVQLSRTRSSTPVCARARAEDQGLVDPQARRITYLRLSLTDRCNYRCTYCMPEQGIEQRQRSEL